ncbi:hypothetical protein C0991_002713, partial [Blastosporella zonata]
MFLVIEMWVKVMLFDFFRNSSPVLSERIAIVNLHTIKPTIGMHWMAFLPPVFNDAIIIWRAWILSGRMRWALLLAIALCVASL